MKYLDTLAKLRKAGQGTEAGHAELQKTANLKVTYIKAKGEFRNLEEQAFDHIKASEDPGSMRALYQVLMHNISWEAIPSMFLRNCCGMIFRTVAFDISSITM